MTNDQEKKRPLVKKREKSRFRKRLSSIKTEKSLSLIEKKAITLNYLLKA